MKVLSGISVTVVVLFLVLYSIFGNSLAQLANLSNQVAISVFTDRATYNEGDPIRIFGNVGTINQSTNIATQVVPMPQKIVITINKIGDGNAKNPFSNLSIFSKHDGSYNATTTSTELGLYEITADTGNSESKATFTVKSPWFSKTAIFGYFAIAFFAALMVLTVLQFRRKESDLQKYQKSGEKLNGTIEVIRFVCLSGIALSLVFSLYFTDQPIGVHSPVGLVIKPSLVNGIPQPGGQWMINVGGYPLNYTEGIQIPVSVAVFGILGGYARYLYGVRWIYTDRSRVESEWGDIRLGTEVDKFEDFKHTLRSISLFIIAPILAMAIYALLFQGGTSIYAIAAVSFTIGLITEEATLKLIDFTRAILAGIKGTATPAPIVGGLTPTKPPPASIVGGLTPTKPPPTKLPPASIVGGLTPTKPPPTKPPTAADEHDN